MESMPRFLFIHRVDVSGIKHDDIPTYMDNVRNSVKNSSNLPLLEYFIPNRDGKGYSLTIVDLNNLNTVTV